MPEPAVWLEADPVRLAQVIGNLLNNAAKYSERSGRIWLTAERHGREVAIAVRDAGIGVAPELLPHIFDLFVQEDRSVDRCQGGLGIGLTLVRRLVEMHGGRVEARSQGQGKGSEFTVHLPLPKERSVGTLKGSLAQGQPSQSVCRILIVDDNMDAAESLAMLLRLGGHEIRVAHDGVSALQALRAFEPTLVVLDIGMPGMDGYEVARRIRLQPVMQPAMLVALTGWGQEEDRRRTKLAGFDYHLVKPVEPDALQELLSDPRLITYSK